MVVAGTLIANETLNLTGDITVALGGLITHDITAANLSLNITGNINVEDGGAIDVSGKGFGENEFPNPTTFDPQCCMNAAAGGSHGGLGGGDRLTPLSADGLPVLPGFHAADLPGITLRDKALAVVLAAVDLGRHGDDRGGPR